MQDANRSLEEQIRNWCKRTSAALDRRILNDLGEKLQQPEPIQPAPTPAGIWRMIMISRRVKLAAAAVIALAILLPAGYAAVEAAVNYFTISEDHVSIEMQEPNHAVGFTARRDISVGGANIATETEARAGLEEFYRLYHEGKAREIQPGLWQATLANGAVFNYRGNPEWPTPDFAAQKSEFEEVSALRNAGKGERTFRQETELNGQTLRVYEVRYTLSSGKVVTVTEMVNPDGSLAGMGGGFGGGKSVP
jgi:hypothetical protein